MTTQNLRYSYVTYTRVDIEETFEDPVENIVCQNVTTNSDEEFEPYSLAVSEYIPDSDSYESDENTISIKNACEQRKKRKIQNCQEPQYVKSSLLFNTSKPQVCTTSEFDLVSIKPPLKDTKFTTNLEAGVQTLLILAVIQGHRVYPLLKN